MAGRELHRTILEGPYSKTATGQKTLNTGRGPYLRGLPDDITLCHYGACDICQSFGDAVCVTARQQPFASASDGARPVHYNCATGERN